MLYSLFTFLGSVLETILASYEAKHPEIAHHARTQVELSKQLDEATRQLNRYRSIYGEPSTLPPDVTRLSEALAKKEEELRALRLQDTERAQAEAPLYSELDKLSVAWESLDKQMKSKILDASAYEERLRKVAAEVCALFSLLERNPF